MHIGYSVIEVCTANAACVAELLSIEKDHPEVSVLEAECMSQCELCASTPYVFMDGHLIEADTVPSLLELIRARVAEQRHLYETDT